MNINKYENKYTETLFEKTYIQNTDKFHNYVKNNLSFKYVDINYKEFSKKYEDSNRLGEISLSSVWFSRKVAAIPLAVWFGVIKTTHGLTTALFKAMIPSKENTFSTKKRFFFIARDLQESFGWLTTLFNDKYGQYHVLESHFYKEHCYPNNERSNTIEPFNKQLTISRIKNNPQSIQDLDYRAFKDKDVVIAAIESYESYEALEIFKTASYSIQNNKQTAIALVKADPALLGELPSNLKKNEGIFIAAIKSCKTPDKVHEVFSMAEIAINKKIALAFVKKNPNLFQKLPLPLRNNKEILLTALKSCVKSEQADTIFYKTSSSLKAKREVILAFIEKSPTLLWSFNSDIRNDPEAVLLAIKQSTKDTIHTIWSSIGNDAKSNQKIRCEMDKKYPGFLSEKEPSIPSSFNSQKTPSQTPQTPSDGESIATNILSRYQLLPINLFNITIALPKEQNKRILCDLLSLDNNISDKELKKAYFKTSKLIHPDKLKSEAGENAFKVLNAAYEQIRL